MESNLHGCDILWKPKKSYQPYLYFPIHKAYRPTYNTIAVELSSKLKVLIRASGGQKYKWIDEWKFLPEFDINNQPGGYYDFCCRSPNAYATTWRDKDKKTGKYQWYRTQSFKIED
jgi:hypothetical protein